MTCPRSLHGR